MIPSDPISNRRSSVAFKATLGVVLAIGALIVAAVALVGQVYLREYRIQAAVNARGGHVNLEDDETLPLLQKVSAIRLSSTALTSDDLELIATARHLQSLELTDARLTDAGVTDLIHSLQGKEIGHLDLSYNPLTSTSFVQLASLSKLQVLLLDRTQVTGSGLADLAALPNLSVLSLEGAVLGETELAALGMLSPDCWLGLNGAQFDEMGVYHLRKFHTLLLGQSNLTDAGIEQLVSNSQIVSLDLNHTTITARSLRALRQVSSLKELWLAETTIGDGDLKELIGAPNLQLLSLRGCPVTDAATEALLQITTLEDVRLVNTVLTDVGLMKLGALPKLKSIYVSGTAVTPSGYNQFRTRYPQVDIER